VHFGYQRSLPRCITCHRCLYSTVTCGLNTFYNHLNWILEDLFPCYCYIIASKGVNAHSPPPCGRPWWILLLKIECMLGKYVFLVFLSLYATRNFRGTCSSIKMLKGYMARVSLGTPELEELAQKKKKTFNKKNCQELNESIGIKLLTSGFLESFFVIPNFQDGMLVSPCGRQCPKALVANVRTDDAHCYVKPISYWKFTDRFLAYLTCGERFILEYRCMHCASLNHRGKRKGEPNRLIPRNLAASLELIIKHTSIYDFCVFHWARIFHSRF